jgi:hypothetical protein
MDSYSLGQLLQQARDSREWSLEDVRAKTRIPTPVLESFEQGVFVLPELSPVQVRGMLTNYAHFLGLDVEQVQAAYADILNPPKRRRRPDPTQSTRPTTEARRPATDPRRASGEYRRPDPSEASRPRTPTERPRKPARSANLLNVLVILTLAAASVAVIAVIVSQLINRTISPIDETLPTLPIGLADLPPTATFTSIPTRIYVVTPTLAPRSQQNYNGEPVLVTVEFQQRAWVSVSADGAQLYSGLVRPGELTLEYRGINEVVVNSSNAEALIITYNGQPQPSFGERGQAITITFRPANDIQILTGPGFDPTADISATPQNTPLPLAATLLAEQTPSPTFGPSPTLSPTPAVSPTPSPTATASPTLTPSFTPSDTPTPTATLPPTTTPTPTALVPPQVTPVGATPEKP